MPTDLQKKVLDQINEQEIVRFGMGLADIHSPTGLEAEAVRFWFEEFSKLGLRTKLQEISQNRFNALAELPGTGAGFSLMFNGHLDISYTKRELHVPGGENAFRYRQNPEAEQVDGKSTLQEGWIVGNGIRNMKSAHAAYFGAVAAILRAGVKLKGDILVAAVSGEIEKAPVDDFQGVEYQGYGEGTRYLVTHGGVADGCILGEPTKLQVMVGNFGALWLKLSTRGQISHTAWCDQVDNCIEAMANFVPRLRAWIDDYRRKVNFHGISPQVNISSFQGGWPWRLSRTPTYCNLYLDIRYAPGVNPLQIKEEIKRLVATVKKDDPRLDVEVDLLVNMPPAYTPPEDPIIQTIKTAHHTIFGENPNESFDGAFTDASHLTSYGIPAVIYGPGGRNKPGIPDYVYGYQSVEDLINATRVYALAALNFCMQERKG